MQAMIEGQVAVMARLRAREAGDGRLRAELVKLLAPTRAEAGCRVYELLQADADSRDFLFYEVWESKAALDAHLQQPHVQQFLRSSGDLLDGPLDITMWRVIGEDS